MNIASAIDFGCGALDEAGITAPRREAASLLCYILNKNAAFLIAHPEYELTADRSLLFKSVVRRRALREPFQYIVGRQEFYGLAFEVRPAVLIPRPETEILVETAINFLSRFEHPRFFEIGVGSGCISISILYTLQKASGVGVDISEQALESAAQNARKHGVTDRLILREANLFDGLGESFDLIVSNPPYIPDADIASLQPEVVDFEPRTALAGGIDGLSIIERIVDNAPSHIRTGGGLIIEIGFGQAALVRGFYDPGVWSGVEFLPDLQGIPRIVKATMSN